MRADRQTDRHAHRNTSHPYQERSNKSYITKPLLRITAEKEARNCNIMKTKSTGTMHSSAKARLIISTAVRRISINE